MLEKVPWPPDGCFLQLDEKDGMETSGPPLLPQPMSLEVGAAQGRGVMAQGRPLLPTPACGDEQCRAKERQGGAWERAVCSVLHILLGRKGSLASSL